MSLIYSTSSAACEQEWCNRSGVHSRLMEILFRSMCVFSLQNVDVIFEGD